MMQKCDNSQILIWCWFDDYIYIKSENFLLPVQCIQKALRNSTRILTWVMDDEMIGNVTLL